MTKHRLATKAIHAGEPRPAIQGAVCVPIFQSSTYEDLGQGSYHDLRYMRLNNTPNHVALHAKLAALENTEDALVMASGMAAISAALLTVLQSGDHVLCQDCLYGGTHDFITKDLPALGIDHDFIDPNRPETWADLVRPTTRAFYVETITNPLMRVMDLAAVVDFSQAHGLVSMIDNTFATPIFFRPAEHGFDLSIHSGTKYLNGHSDIVAGAVLGSSELIERVTHKLNHLGGSLDAHACFLLHRGLKTLPLRMAHHHQSALEIARHLESHPAVARVFHPGLTSNPDHDRAAKLLDGYPGMISFELKGGLGAADDFLAKVELPFVAPSLGGVETLVTRPATTSHAGLSPAERQAAGISEALVRVSIGLEDTRDLIADFDQALA
ncbi:MAG: aminotransferase class I/II-fold pyridoxal phosphate-dependent enzyme [Proteobacteria bacterium]|nr:aminotransferase class I/II-fold pyridoxal phosphate-dependent enzyme [Pseudomonadota bacterium]MBU1742289.1 aminotransferase class I/II-fold pyridoxal phosphate-dependent enzyme [Pseudomonadota bacterium]